MHTPLLQLGTSQSLMTPQWALAGQGRQPGPPQSTSLSLPSVTPSTQVGSGSAHAPLRQTAVMQSSQLLQAWSTPHGLQSCEPQSVAASSSSRTPSLQWGAGSTHSAWVREHTQPAQSRPARQWPSMGHGGQTRPPQSTSLSSPSFTPSLHAAGGALHCPFTQPREAQSAGTWHSWPSTQRAAQTGPPQSTSLSVPSTRVSAHASAHTPDRHAPPLQSLALLQARPSPQPLQLPPQSTSLSSPSLTPSAHS
jgi:hypothetical protein